MEQQALLPVAVNLAFGWGVGVDVIAVLGERPDRILVAKDGADVHVSCSSVRQFAPGSACFHDHIVRILSLPPSHIP